MVQPSFGSEYTRRPRPRKTAHAEWKRRKDPGVRLVDCLADEFGFCQQFMKWQFSCQNSERRFCTLAADFVSVAMTKIVVVRSIVLRNPQRATGGTGFTILTLWLTIRRMATTEALLLGVDGGATGIRCYEVRITQTDGRRAYALGVAQAEMHYPRLDGFVPVTPDAQRRQLDETRYQIDALEARQGSAWIDTAASVIADVAEQCDVKRVRIGIGMPGIKSVDERGIVMINNGPRMPDFLDALAQRLHERGMKLVQPIRRIGDDGAYCGVGEAHAKDGLFRDIQNGYYIGGGTGLAECLLIDGAVVPMSGRHCTIPRAWELVSPLGVTYEKLISAASMNAVYQGLANVADGAPQRFPEQDALHGDPVARSWMHMAATLWAHLIAARLVHFCCEAATKVQFDRVVIGQRAGQLFSDAKYRSLFAEPIEENLVHILKQQAARHSMTALLNYVDGDRLRDGLLVASQLRAAPAIGAAVDAMGDPSE